MVFYATFVSRVATMSAREAGLLVETYPHYRTTSRSGESEVSEQREEIRKMLEAAVERPLPDSVDYFDAGGDSLSTMEFIENARDRFGVDLPASIFYESGAVGELLDKLCAAVGDH
jgi:acyl carrier protein